MIKKDSRSGLPSQVFRRRSPWSGLRACSGSVCSAEMKNMSQSHLRELLATPEVLPAEKTGGAFRFVLIVSMKGQQAGERTCLAGGLAQSLSVLEKLRLLLGGHGLSA